MRNTRSSAQESQIRVSSAPQLKCAHTTEGIDLVTLNVLMLNTFLVDVSGYAKTRTRSVGLVVKRADFRAKKMVRQELTRLCNTISESPKAYQASNPASSITCEITTSENGR